MINLSAMDMGLSIGFFAIFALFGSLNYATIFSIAPFMNETAITIIGLLLLFGAMAKSAQIPLHSWLPGSMEGSLYNLIIFNKILKLIFLIFLLYYLIYLLILNNLFIYFLENSNYYYSLEFYLMSTLPISSNRDGKGRFISIKKTFNTFTL
jgi:formate hydrogenlyase subunit 3/multisubunit Na+/H+ antiporter MnhD subunit